jgi:hypothetical protein
VETVLADALLRHDLDRHVHVVALGITQNDPVLLRLLPRYVPQGVAPEGEHRREIVAIDHDRADLHLRLLTCRDVPILGRRKPHRLVVPL